ncbi:Protein MAIN-LIKE 1 [Glycine max]|nr:Protein MAIN-LIKE 1 [Glycine max]
MVRTRGLGRALGRVIGRGRGREDRDDSDDAPQRRRPIASTHRQRVSVTIVDDELVVPTDSPVVPVVPVAEPVVATDEPMVDGDTSADTGAEAAANEPEGFPSGSTNLSLLTKYAEHVAASERPELNLSSHGRKVQKLGRSVPAIEGLVAGTGLSPLIACSVDTDDQGLISSFVERWHQEIVTITLDDVASLIHVPIVGDFHTFQPLHVDEAVLMLVDLLMVTPEAAKAETRHCHEPYVRDTYQRRCQAGHWTTAAHAYLLHLLGCTLFANKSATHVHVVFLDALRDLSQTRRYAWGAAALCWIYEHFLSIAECNADPNYDEVSPRACRWIATKKTVKSISIETYRQRLN